MALNILLASSNTKKIYLAYKSKYNRKCKDQVVLLMITDNEEDTPDKWHYLAVKSIARLFRGMPSSNNRDFYCLGCLHSVLTGNALKKHERLCDNHDYCEIVMPTEDNNTLKYNPGEKSLNVANIIYMDLESLLIKQQSSQIILRNHMHEKRYSQSPWLFNKFNQITRI